jgi:hypothetical protein
VPPKKRTQQRSSQRPPQKRAGQQPPRQAPAGRPAGSQQRSFYTSGASPFRHAVERRSAPLLVLLRNAPRLVVSLLPLALFLLGLFLPLPYGYIALAVFLLFTGWLAYLSWPNADARAKGIRVLMFLLVIVLIVVRVVRA